MQRHGGEVPPKLIKSEKVARKDAERFIIDELKKIDSKTGESLLTKVTKAYEEAHLAAIAASQKSLFKEANPLVLEALRLGELRDVVKHLASPATWDTDWHIPTKRFLDKRTREEKPKPGLLTTAKRLVIGEDPLKTMDKADYKKLVADIHEHAVFNSDLSQGSDNAFLDAYPELVRKMPYTKPRVKRLQKEHEGNIIELKVPTRTTKRNPGQSHPSLPEEKEPPVTTPYEGTTLEGESTFFADEIEVEDAEVVKADLAELEEAWKEKFEISRKNFLLGYGEFGEGMKTLIKAYEEYLSAQLSIHQDHTKYTRALHDAADHLMLLAEQRFVLDSALDGERYQAPDTTRELETFLKPKELQKIKKNRGVVWQTLAAVCMAGGFGALGIKVAEEIQEKARIERIQDSGNINLSNPAPVFDPRIITSIPFGRANRDASEQREDTSATISGLETSENDVRRRGLEPPDAEVSGEGRGGPL